MHHVEVNRKKTKRGAIRGCRLKKSEKMNEGAKTIFCAESPFHKHVANFYRKPSWEQNEASLPPPESASIASIGCILRGSPGPRTSDEEALLASLIRTL